MPVSAGGQREDGAVKTMLLIAVLVLGAAAAGFWFGYSPRSSAAADMATAASGEGGPLGPVEGHDLAATDVARVALDSEAPDFRLRAYSGNVVSLSDFRGSKDVVLVFYRGLW